MPDNCCKYVGRQSHGISWPVAVVPPALVHYNFHMFVEVKGFETSVAVVAAAAVAVAVAVV